MTGRDPIQHEVKILTPYFAAIRDDLKPFELRKDDREPRYEPGDSLWLREWHPDTGYSGRELHRGISYVLRGEAGEKFGLQPGFAILGLWRSPFPTLNETNVLVLRTARHPEADGRQAQHGDEECRIKMPLEKNNWLELRLGVPELDDLARVVKLEQDGRKLQKMIPPTLPVAGCTDCGEP